MLILTLLAGCMVSGQSWAVEIYRYIDENGRLHLTDKPPHDGYPLIKKTGKKVQQARINLRDKEINRKRFSGKIAVNPENYFIISRYIDILGIKKLTFTNILSFYLR